MCVGCIVGPGNQGNYSEKIEEMYDDNKQYSNESYQ
jgi:hypothetical protein